MATLQFKGKSAVWNHHLSVPYHTLEKKTKKSLKGKHENENLIIEGDNLLALKSLLPQYQGQVKCVYIDPPYNTGKEEWVYNDNVNSPTIQSWLGKVVGKEGEDLTRHDKWLCMMVPRLKLLHSLLSQEGVIFISINDWELHHLRSVMNDIFGDENFVATFVRQSIKGGIGPSIEVRKTHDYVVAYAKSKKDSELQGLEIDAQELDLEDEKGPYRKGRELNKWGAGSRREDSPTMWFPIKGPEGEEVYPIRNDGSEGRWRWGKMRMGKAVVEGNVIFETRSDGTYIVYEKVREDSVRRRAFSTLEIPNANGTEEVKELFDGKSLFDYPKPTALVSFLVSLCANGDDDIILDSFAGSGTTAHAVLKLNAVEETNRRFILVQLPEETKKGSPAYKAGYKWVHEITRERVKKVINQNKSKIGFTYSTLGPAIDAETILSGKLPAYTKFAKYVYYLATGHNHPKEKDIKEKQGFVGKSEHESIYLLYEKDMSMLKKLAITLDWVRETNKKDSGKKIVYAPACYLDEETLDQFNIKFVSIPYNLFEHTS